MSIGIPRIMKIISLTFKIIALLMFLFGLGGLMVGAFMKAVTTGYPGPEISTTSVIVDFIAQNTDKFFLLLILTAALVYLASESFLKLKIWAKTFLEIFSWLSLLFLIGAGIFLNGILTADILGDLIKSFEVIVVFCISLLGIPFVLLIFSLHKPLVKECFDRQGIMHESKR